jgi:pimeloyl-ACP methyl ester carboxylesterase
MKQRRSWLFKPAVWVSAVGIALIASACSDTAETTTTNGAPSQTDPPTATTETLAATETWTEQHLWFTVGSDELHGILTLPNSDGPHPAVVMPFKSPSTGGGLPLGVSSTYQTDLARRLADAGYAAFRYDPTGVGGSEGEAGFQSLQERGDETIAALHGVQEHPAIRADEVGLWGISQEAWVISIAAAEHPDDVAFMISVSGSGVSVAEQQVWGIETQSRAAGLEPDDVQRATLFGRLVVDWQLTDPLFRDVNQQAAESLGNGPWHDFLALVYETDTINSAEGLSRAIEILTSIQDEPWAASLYLRDVIIPALQGIPPDQIEAVRASAEQSLLLDPRDHLTKVQSPVLAFFGEEDIVQPSEKSAALYAQYLEEARNGDVTIVILDNVGHDILLSTPSYWEQLVEWLDNL